MKITPIRGFLFAGALCALVVSARAQYVTLRATINQAQENPPTGSAATGTAIMQFYPASNTFDLMVSVTGWTGTATASHIHEAAVGTNGPVMSPNFGGDAAYAKVGNTLTGTFLNQRYTGSAAELLKGNAYYNLHSTAFPGGEIRGQLAAQPVRLVAKMDVPQEAVAMPTQSFAGLNDFGGAVMWYNPATNQISLRSSVYNFTNTLNNSHFHAGAPTVSGPVVHGLGGNANAAPYSNTSGAIQGSFDGLYLGDPVVLLSGGAYLNYHSTTFTGGELRGQVTMAAETPSTRMANLSVRGFVGTGEQVLITGISITGDEPVRVLITAKGPSLTALGVTGALANPVLRLFDSANRLIATNDDVGAIAAGSELASIPWAPRTAAESALVVVLPPGNYTASVSAATGTGVALLEVYDLRSINPAVVTN